MIHYVCSNACHLHYFVVECYAALARAQLSIAGYMRRQKPGTIMMCAVRQSAIVLPKEGTVVLKSEDLIGFL